MFHDLERSNCLSLKNSRQKIRCTFSVKLKILNEICVIIKFKCLTKWDNVTQLDIQKLQNINN